MALVLNGLQPVDPVPVVPEKPESVATDYWLFPLTLATQYHQMARLFALSCDPKNAFHLLKKLDEDEGDEWVHRHRMADDVPLGSLVKTIMDENMKLWKPLHSGGGGATKNQEGNANSSKSDKQWKEQIAALQTQNANLKRKSPTGGRQEPPKKATRGDKKSGNPVTLKALLNGSTICEGYSKGTCTGACARTPPELHVCNGKMKTGKKDVACGRKHNSYECTFCLQRS